MTDTDETVDNEVTEEDTETEDSMPTKDKQKRISELKAELSDLEGKGPVEDTIDGDVVEITDAVEDEAEDIAKGGDKPAGEVEEEADAAAEGIAAAAKRQGVTFTDEEIDGIARRIATRTKQIEAEDKKDNTDETADEKPAERQSRQRTPDRRPRGTHFSERRLWGKGR